MSKEKYIRRAILARRLYREGWSMESIGERLGIKKQVVSTYVNRKQLYNIDLEDYEKSHIDVGIARIGPEVSSVDVRRLPNE